MPKSAEFILQPHLNSVVLVEPYGPAFAGILEKLSQDPTVQVVECVSAMDTLSVVRQMGSCVIVAHAGTTGDANQTLTILKTLAAQIQQRKSVRMIVTAGSALSAELVEKLTIYGCTEILPDSTPAKAILFKLDRHLKALPRAGQALDNDVDVTRIPGVTGPSHLPGDLENPTPEPAAGVRLGPALDLPQDCWCLSGGGARKQGEHWRVRVRGPAPDQGRWMLGEKGERWQWQRSDAAAEQAPSPQSGWFFEGEQRPEYHRGFWTFTAARPALVYLENGNTVGCKFALTDKGSLLVARDSDSALSWLAIARGTIARKAARHEVQVALAPAPAPVLAAPVEAKVVYVDPLELGSDFWAAEKLVPKRVAERWLIQLVGPGPAVGRWVAQGESRGGSPEKWWRWVPDLGDRDPFHKEQGSWCFFGLAPNFGSGTWSFASSSPELGFYYQGHCYGARFRVTEHPAVLELARDSAAAEDALPLIRSSFERPVSPRADTKPLPPPAGGFEPASLERGSPDGRPSRDAVQDTPASEGPGTADFADRQAVPEGLEKIFAAEVPGPTLSVLALAYLASELVGRRGGGGVRERCDRYCAYLTASFGGLRAELWIPAGEGRWACVGTPDHGEGRFGEAARAGVGLRTFEAGPVRVVDVRPALQDPVGLLVVGGRGAQKIELAYAQAAARVAVGLVFGARTALERAEGARAS